MNFGTGRHWSSKGRGVEGPPLHVGDDARSAAIRWRSGRHTYALCTSFVGLRPKIKGCIGVGFVLFSLEAWWSACPPPGMLMYTNHYVLVRIWGQADGCVAAREYSKNS